MPHSPNSVIQADPLAFGRLVSQIRKSHGLTQENVVSRVPGHYGEVRSYRRIEAGARTPARDAAIAILRHGLEVNSQAAINQGLSLLSYTPLAAEEAAALNLAHSDEAAPIVAAEDVSTGAEGWYGRFSANRNAIAAAVIATSLVVGAIMAFWLTADAPLVLGSGIMYGALCAVSVLLESHVHVNRDGIPIAAALAFGVALVGSIAAVVSDAALVHVGSGGGLVAAVGFLWAAAAGQWLVVRPALEDRPVAPLRYQALTAQAAHLKNTLYFVLLATVFWIPPMHAVVVLERESQFGHIQFVHQAVSHQIFIIAKGIITPTPSGLVCAFVVMLLVAIWMADPLLSNLKQDRRQNGYCILLYTRTALFVGLSIVWIGWYSTRMAIFAA